MRKVGDDRILKHVNFVNLSDECHALIQENVKARQYRMLKRVSAKPKIIDLKEIFVGLIECRFERFVHSSECGKREGR